MTRLLHSPLGSALTNARQAAADIALSVYERATLTTSLRPASPEDVLPGQLTELTTAEARSLLARGRIGRFAYVARAGTPDIVPVNYVLAGETILVASGPGPKLQAADRHDLVAFEVDEFDHDARTGWSVVAIGTARRLTPDQRRLVAQRGDIPDTWATGPRHELIAIEQPRVSGRRLH